MRLLTVYGECGCSPLGRRSATRLHFTGSEATSSVASTMLSLTSCPFWYSSRCRAYPTIPGGGMPAYRPGCWVLSSLFCQGQCLHCPEDWYSIGQQKFLYWTTSLKLSTQHSAIAWSGLWTVQTTRHFCSSKTAHTSDFLFLCAMYKFIYLP